MTKVKAQRTHQRYKAITIEFFSFKKRLSQLTKREEMPKKLIYVLLDYSLQAYCLSWKVELKDTLNCIVFRYFHEA